jgi:hypothetical protein
LPGQPPWSTNSNKTQKTQLLSSNNGTFRALVVCENFNPKTNPLLSSSMQQVSCKCETPRSELMSSWTFLAIKRCEGTTIGKVIKQSRNSIYKLVHIVCATRGIPVNDIPPPRVWSLLCVGAWPTSIGLTYLGNLAQRMTHCTCYLILFGLLGLANHLC